MPLDRIGRDVLTPVTGSGGGGLATDRINIPVPEPFTPRPDVIITDHPTTDTPQGLPVYNPPSGTEPVQTTGEPLPMTQDVPIVDPNITDIFDSPTLPTVTPPHIDKIKDASLEYEKRMRERYDEIMSMSPAELAAAGIQLVDGSYFKDNKAYLTLNWIEKIEDKWGPVLDENGTYKFPLDIPKAFALEVATRFPNMPFDQQVELARRAYAIGGAAYKAVYSNGSEEMKYKIVKQSVDTAVKKEADAGTDIGQSVVEQENKNVFLWVVAGVILLLLIIKMIK